MAELEIGESFVSMNPKVTGEHPLYVKKGAEPQTETTRLEKIQTSLAHLLSNLRNKLLDIIKP